MIVTFLLNTSAFDPRSIDVTRLREHRIIKRSSDNLPGGLFTPKSPKRQSAGCRVLSFPVLRYGGRKEDSAENSPANVSGQFRVPMAPAASYDFHVDGQAAIAAKRAFPSPSPLSLSSPVVFLSSFLPPRRPYRDEEKHVYSSKRDYPSFASQRIFPPRASLPAQSPRLCGMIRRNESS